MCSKTEATRRWLNDIKHHIAMAQGFIAGMNCKTFKDDNLHLYAVTRCLEKARHPSIEWQKMADAGNVYRHEYEDPTARRVWQTATVSLPLLQDVVVQELAALEPDRSQ